MLFRMTAVKPKKSLRLLYMAKFTLEKYFLNRSSRIKILLSDFKLDKNSPEIKALCLRGKYSEFRRQLVLKRNTIPLG